MTAGTDNYHQLQINDCLLYYCRRGTGPPLYALHGGPGLDHSTLANGMEALEKRFTVYYIDQRGHGRSSRTPSSTYTFAQLAQDVEGLRLALGHSRVTLLGHSLGAKVAIVYALEHADRLDALILVSANSAPPQFAFAFLAAPGRLAAKLKLIAWSLEGGIRKLVGRPWTLEEEQRQFWQFAWELYSRRENPSIHLREILLGSIHPPLDAFPTLMDQLARIDFTAEMRRLRVRTLIACGEEDILFWEEQHTLFPIPGAAFASIANAGHFPHIDEPALFASTVFEFLDTAPRVTPARPPAPNDGLTNGPP